MAHTEKRSSHLDSFELSPRDRVQDLSLSNLKSQRAPSIASSFPTQQDKSRNTPAVDLGSDDEIQFLFQTPLRTPFSTPSLKRKRPDELVNSLQRQKGSLNPHLNSSNNIRSCRGDLPRSKAPTRPQSDSSTQGQVERTAAIHPPANPSTPNSKPSKTPHTPHSTPKASKPPSTASTPQTSTKTARPSTPSTPRTPDASTASTPKRRKHQWSKKTYLDMAQTLQTSFSFADFAAKHALETKEVYDAFSAIVLSPLLEQGTKGKDMVRDFRGAERELMGRLKEVAKTVGKETIVVEEEVRKDGNRNRKDLEMKDA